MGYSNIAIVVKAMVGKSSASYFYLLEKWLSFTNFTTNIKIGLKIVIRVVGNKIIKKNYLFSKDSHVPFKTITTPTNETCGRIIHHKNKNKWREDRK